jgi:hypothetical protein
MPADVNIDLTKPVTTLIEKIADGVGVIYEPTRIRKKAQAEGDALIILAKAGVKANSIEGRAINRLIKTETVNQKNIESIIDKTIPDIEESAEPEKIEDDWLNNFFDKSKGASDDEMQAAWARLLSGEANKPGSFSKRTINLLAELDKKDAELFTSLAQFSITIYNGHTIPYIDEVQKDVYSRAGLDFASLQHLDSLGLIKFDAIGGYNISQPNTKGGSFLVEYQEKRFWVKVPDEQDMKLSTGNVMYTKLGLELLRICSPINNEVFYAYLRSSIVRNGAVLVESN